MTSQCIATGQYNAFVNLEPIEKVSRTSYRKTRTLVRTEQRSLVGGSNGWESETVNIRKSDRKEVIIT